jgi:beta-lactamase superfamily II metal-dependent hydrolase
MLNRFVGLGANHAPVYLYEKDRTTRFRQVLWGDFLTIGQDFGDGWLEVIWAPNDPARRRELAIPAADTITTRPLEIVFVDVGQGDGAVLITPERDRSERVVVIDAGVGSNMGRFLNGRFGSYRRGFDFHAAVITHPDADHYGGFQDLFEDQDIGFSTVYHSGLVERPVPGEFEKLGGLSPQDPVTGQRYVTGPAEDRAAIAAAFGDPVKNARYRYGRLMQAALDNPRITDFRMLSTAHGSPANGHAYVPGFGPAGPFAYTLEVLGPVVEPDAQGRPRLRALGSYAETKNGHSVVLKLAFGDFTIFFGGDLNDRAQRFLLAHYAGLDTFPAPGTLTSTNMVADASRTLRSDVMKVCHHGSEKVVDEFMASVNAAAFVISSGDAEGHVHPRPDLLGRLGKLGRGSSPVLLATELQRSTRAMEDPDVVDALKKDVGRLFASPSTALRDDIVARVGRLARTNVDVWGAIYVKTDGKRLIAAFKKESGSDLEKWFYFEYAIDQAGELQLVG